MSLTRLRLQNYLGLTIEFKAGNKVSLPETRVRSEFLDNLYEMLADEKGDVNAVHPIGIDMPEHTTELLICYMNAYKWTDEKPPLEKPLPPFFSKKFNELFDMQIFGKYYMEDVNDMAALQTMIKDIAESVKIFDMLQLRTLTSYCLALIAWYLNAQKDIAYKKELLKFVPQI